MTYISQSAKHAGGSLDIVRRHQRAVPVLGYQHRSDPILSSVMYSNYGIKYATSWAIAGWTYAAPNNTCNKTYCGPSNSHLRFCIFPDQPENRTNVKSNVKSAFHRQRLGVKKRM